jgi:hypothetical protein
MNSSPKDSKPSAFKHTEPILIGRRRSASMSSGSSSLTSSPDEPKTPLSFTAPRVPNVSPSTSPILSYVLSQSPTKPNGSFPLKRKFGASPVFDEDEMDRKVPVTAHVRRATTTVASRFGPGQPKPNLPSSHHDRGTGMLRRLSLSNTMPKLTTDSPYNLPSPPPNSATSPSVHKGSPLSSASPATHKPKRSATLSPDVGRPRRAPSPMGERILKGHFDGFN